MHFKNQEILNIKQDIMHGFMYMPFFTHIDATVNKLSE
jgi:predicted amino acid-binding ACT domain protein